MSDGLKIASSLRMSIISFKIIAERLAMTGGSPLAASYLSLRGGTACPDSDSVSGTKQSLLNIILLILIKHESIL